MPGSIIIRNFRKQFGSVTAVDGISLEIQSGELFGLIGPDGAGKTTTMRTLCTLLPCEEGELLVDERNVRTEIHDIRSILGYMPQRFSLYPDLSVEQNLRFFADLFQVPEGEKREKLEQLYAFSRLGPFKSRLAHALSGGMKQKLALSCTLIHTPRILILDEPTTGVDPVSRQEFWQILRQLRDDGVTILVSTPYMDEAGLCDRVAFVYNGKILALDKPENLPDYFPHRLYEVATEAPRKLLQFFKQQPEVHSVQLFGGRLHISSQNEVTESTWKEWRQLAPASFGPAEPIAPTVEDTFLELMPQAAELPIQNEK